MSEVIKHFRDLKVYQNAKKAAMEIYELTKTFPKEEKYSLIDQIRRSSRSVCLNIAEAWHKRRYKAAFVAKLSDAESEAAETQVWLDFSLECSYIDKVLFDRHDDEYSKIIGQLIRMINDCYRPIKIPRIWPITFPSLEVLFWGKSVLKGSFLPSDTGQLMPLAWKSHRSIIFPIFLTCISYHSSNLGGLIHERMGRDYSN